MVHCSFPRAVPPVVTTRVAVTVVELVSTGGLVVETATPVQPPVPKVTVGPAWNPPPEIEIGTSITVLIAGVVIAEGLTLSITMPVTVSRAVEVVVPPSGLVTVTVYVPGVAELPVTELVGLTYVERVVVGTATEPPPVVVP
jgi:hypothetical protein